MVLNTFPSPFEMDDFIEKVRLYDSWGVSGFIVTDPGAIALIRQQLPHTLIHVSIGSGITNALDARFYKSLGADVIILPYRWGADEIEATRETSDIGLEVFLFETVQTGKVCPGKCIMSSYLKFRDWLDIEGKDHFFGSANRGAKECYRVCQTQWDFASEDSDPVSLKLRRDARLMLEQLPHFIGLGVECFKISGRERPTTMIRDLVRFYRKVIDGITSGSQTDMSVYVEELAVLARALERREAQTGRGADGSRRYLHAGRRTASMTPPLGSLRAAFEATGSPSWVMQVIREQGFDRRHGFHLDLMQSGDRGSATAQATQGALAAGEADLIDTDWISIARSRQPARNWFRFPHMAASWAAW